MKQQGIQSTSKTDPDTDREENFKTSIVFCNNMDPFITQEGKITPTYTDASQSCLIKEIEKFT